MALVLVGLESSINHATEQQSLGPRQCQGWVNVGEEESESL